MNLIDKIHQDIQGSVCSSVTASVWHSVDDAAHRSVHAPVWGSVSSSVENSVYHSVRPKLSQLTQHEPKS